MIATLRLWDGYPHTSPDLRPDVRELQRALNIVADGYFGRDTESAVLDYQAANGLVQDGIVGARTWAKIQGEPYRYQYDTSYSVQSRALNMQLKVSEQYRPWIEAGTKRAGVEVAVLWGIGSRESNWGLALVPTGPEGTGDKAPRSPRPWRTGAFPPDGGYGRGLMQIDYDAHEFARTGKWKDPEANILYGAEVLGHMQATFMTLRQGIAAYNCGPSNVKRALANNRDVDYYTTGRNYSANVLDRAGWFQRNGWANERET